MAPPPAAKSAPRVSRPAARYRPGKAPLGAGADDYSDSDEDVEHHDDHPTQPSAAADISTGAAALLQAQSTGRRTAGIILNEAGSSSKKLDLRLHSTPGQREGEEDDSSEYETDTDDEPAPAKPVFRKPGTAAPPPAQDSGSSEYETDSSEESDEEPPKPLLKPLFVPKSARATIPSTTTTTEPEEGAEAKGEVEAARRKKEAHDLAAATIQRSLLQSQREADQNTEVDDTDGLDPEAEFEAWRQRELARLRRDRDAMLAKQAEQREIEEFKSLPEAEKERLGRERAAKLRAEKKEQRGSQGFMQKYYHKGSFFQDMDILKRDYSEKTEKEVDVSKLPKMMQRRGWGEKGRGKWTHLANEDTSKAAMRVDVLGGGGSGAGKGCFICGGDHLKRDCPKKQGGETSEGSGSNRQDLASGSRSWGEAQSASKDGREMERERRERSRSPRRDSSRRYDDRDGRDRASGSRRDKERSDDRDSRSHRSRDDRDRERHHNYEEDHHRSHRSHRDEDRSHRSRDDHHKSRSRSDRHESDDRKHSHRHRDDVEDRHDRHKRRDREGDRDRDIHHRSSHSSSGRRHRDEESDRKRSRLDA